MTRYESVNKMFEKSFRDNWNRTALLNYKADSVTYAQLATDIRRIQLIYSSFGLGRGDKVAICAKNQANWGVCLLSALTYGLVPVPILADFSVDSILNLVAHSESRFLFVDSYIWGSLSGKEISGPECIIKVDTLEVMYALGEDVSACRHKMEEEFSAMYPDGFGPGDISYFEDGPEDLALINYTSGTSGFSKGVMLPYRSLYTNLVLAGTYAEPQMSRESRMVAMLPSAHMYGLMFDLLYELTIGASVCILTKLPSPKVILSAFREIRPSAIVTVPLIIEKLYKSYIRDLSEPYRKYLRIPILGRLISAHIRNRLNYSLGGRFEEVIIGGAPFSPEVESFLKKIKFRYTLGYGMTECGPLVTFEKWNRNKKGSCGRAINGCSIRIDSSDPHYLPGEIQVKGDNVFVGYYKNEQATSEAFTKDGWFKTGDMGILDKDGFLFLKGRSKCMILGPSGQNIYPEELEAVINSFKYVGDCLVVEDNGSLVALIYPDYRQASQDGIPAESLERHILALLPDINNQLPSYAQLKQIEFFPEDFERTPKNSIKRYLYQRK